MGSAYALAVAHHLNHPATAVVVGKSNDLKSLTLWRVAWSVYRPGKLASLWDPTISKPPYPPAADGKPVAYVCQGAACSPPTPFPDKLALLLKNFGRAAPAATSNTAGRK
jgi:uncharacterized protein YyaL (SSP411 family)